MKKKKIPFTAKTRLEALAWWLEIDPLGADAKYPEPYTKAERMSGGHGDGVSYRGGYNPGTRQHWLGLRINHDSNLDDIAAQVQHVIPLIKPLAGYRMIGISEPTCSEYRTFDLRERDGVFSLGGWRYGVACDGIELGSLEDALVYIRDHHAFKEEDQ